jgi:isopentenyl-diphosphate delta-isomerase
LIEVVLVNEADKEIGTMEKMAAHRQGLLHRAFSVFIFNHKGEMLLQQRAKEKYHSGGLWTNACCSHPLPGEAVMAGAERRLFEEMGFKTSIEKIFDFTYKAAFRNGLTEYEFDHVFAGYFEGNIYPNKEEVNDFCFKSPEQIRLALKTSPEQYTAWFHIAFPMVENWWKKIKLLQETHGSNSK